jgi:hypothetical protein
MTIKPSKTTYQTKPQNQSAQLNIPKSTYSSTENTSISKPILTPAPIRLICATRENQADFFTKTALGRSLATYPWPVELRLFSENKAGLPSVYNQALRESIEKPALLIFIHDDVYLSDYFWADQVRMGLEMFDIIGLAGNRRRVANQPAWAFIDAQFTWDTRNEHLSGAVAHGKNFISDGVSVFGPTKQEVKLLEGVLIAGLSETFNNKGIRYDEIFDFHFYDLDICRQIEVNKLRMGTWPIAIIHESGGAFGSDSWQAGYAKYLAKWGS